MRGFSTFVAAGALALGCASEHPVRQPPVQAIRYDVLEPLRGFVYAQYDRSLGEPRDLTALEARLRTSLNAAGISERAIEQIKQGEQSPELETFFTKQGLVFRKFVMFGERPGYELVREGSQEEKEATLFGITQRYTKVRIVEELITNWYTFEARKQKSENRGVTGAHLHRTTRIEYRIGQDDEVAQSYLDGEKTLGKQLDEEAKNPQLLNRLIRPSQKLNEGLCKRLGSILHHRGCRELYRNAKNDDDFLNKIQQMFEAESEIHEVMHVIDWFESPWKEKLSQKEYQKLEVEKSIHLEFRAILAEMFHGNPHETVGDVFKMLVGDEPGKQNSHKLASEGIISAFCYEINADRKTYQNIDATGYEPGKEAVLCKQFGKLSAAQIRALAKTIFDKLYQGKRLETYFDGLAQQLEPR